MNPAVMALYLRSVRLESRRVVTYLLRLGLVLTVLCSLITAHLTSMYHGAPGMYFFTAVSFINLVVILLVSLAYFASAVAEEREEMTLGLLRMTGLSPLAILFGKSTSRLIGAGMLIVAQLPFTLLAVSLGGVALLQVYAAYFCLMAFMFVLCNAALLFSVICRRAANAGAVLGVVIIAYFFTPPLASWIASLRQAMGFARGGLWERSFKGLAWLATESNAFVAMSRIVDATFSGPLISTQVVSSVAAGVVCFALAWLFFNLATREQKDVTPSRFLVRTSMSRLSGLRAGRAWPEPIIWKDFNFVVGGMGMQIAKMIVLIGAFLLIGWIVRDNSPRDYIETMGGVLMLVSLIVAYLELVYYASNSLNAEAFAMGERGQTLPGLVMLPLRPSAIVAQKGAACLIALAPYALFFGIGAVMNPDAFYGGAKTTVEHPMLWVTYGYAMLFLLMVAYFSLVLKRGAFLTAFGIMLVGQTMVRSMLSAGLVMFGMMAAGGMGMFAGELFIASFDLAFVAIIAWLLYRGILRRIDALAGQ